LTVHAKKIKIIGNQKSDCDGEYVRSRQTKRGKTRRLQGFPFASAVVTPESPA